MPQQNWGQRGRGSGSRSPSELQLATECLSKGYFDAKGNIFAELVTTNAERIAQWLINGGVTYTQLRRFYGKTKSAEQRLDSGEAFEAVIPRILELKQHAANAVGRAQREAERHGLEGLKRFIDENVRLGSANEHAFRWGFLVLFQGVVAYFKYHGR